MKEAFGVTTVVAMTMVVIGIYMYQNHLLKKRFDTIKLGDKESQVISSMGKPSRIVFAGDKEFWSLNVVGSIKEYQYDARVLPEVWIIGFDSNDIVIYRNHNIM